MLVAILTSLAFVSAVLTILASYQNRRLTLYIFKPLTILFIIAIVLQPKYQTSNFYRYTIHAEILFSLAGDAFLGAVLFIISDSFLAVDRFKRHFRSAQLLILTTYFTAQWLIALST